jgi:DNA-binding GntR family transcriptional regulator
LNAKSRKDTPRDGEASADAVARSIRRMIFEGQLQAGQRLPQDEIAESVGVSRIPVREAIIALEREGWLRVEPHRGAYVNAVDDRAVLDRFALYGRFYGFASRRAMERMSATDLTALSALADDLFRASNPTSFARANNRYLSRLVSLSGSSRLRSVLRSMAQIVPGNFFARVPKSMEIQKECVAELQSALNAGDSSSAERICAEMERRHALQVISILPGH